MHQTEHAWPPLSSVLFDAISLSPQRCFLLLTSPAAPHLCFFASHLHPQVHGECETVRTSFRPVPLTWHFCHATPPPPARRSGQRGGRGAGLLGSSDSEGSGSDGYGSSSGGGGGASSGASPGARLLPLLDPSGRRINPALLPPEKRFSEEAFDDEWGRWDGLRRAKVGWGGGSCGDWGECRTGAGLGGEV